MATRTKWTAEMTEFFKKNYGTMGPTKIAVALGGDVKVNSLVVKASRMGLKYQRRWTPQELSTIAAEYPFHGAVPVAMKLGLSPNTVRQKAYQLGLRIKEGNRQNIARHAKRRSKTLREKEREAIIRFLYPRLGSVKLSQWLGISRHAVASRANGMGVFAERKYRTLHSAEGLRRYRKTMAHRQNLSASKKGVFTPAMKIAVDRAAYVNRTAYWSKERREKNRRTQIESSRCRLSRQWAKDVVSIENWASQQLQEKNNANAT